MQRIGWVGSEALRWQIVHWRLLRQLDLESRVMISQTLQLAYRRQQCIKLHFDIGGKVIGQFVLWSSNAPDTKNCQARDKTYFRPRYSFHTHSSRAHQPRNLIFGRHYRNCATKEMRSRNPASTSQSAEDRAATKGMQSNCGSATSNRDFNLDIEPSHATICDEAHGIMQGTCSRE
jgi:hypothetical protein